MIKEYKHRTLTWVDVENPTRKDITNLMDTYSIHPLVAEDLLQPTIRSKVDLYKDSIHLVLHFPAAEATLETAGEQEIDFIIGKDFIITSRYNTIDALQEFSKAFEVNALLDKSDIGDHAGFLFFFMIKTLYHALSDDLDYINQDLQDIESKIFKGEEKKMVRVLSNINLRLLNFKQALRFHDEVLKSFDEAARTLFGSDFNFYLGAIRSEYYKVFNLVSSLKEMVDDLRDTNDALLTTKTNAAMKTITILAFATLPFTLTAEIFGMNIRHNFLMRPAGFFVVLGIAVSIGVLVFLYFRKKGWL